MSMPKANTNTVSAKDSLAAYIRTVKEVWSEIKTFFGKHADFCRWFFTSLLLLSAMGLLVYFITGPGLAFFHADCADSLMWAQATVESGKILSEDHYYAALLPFGSSLWMVPILHMFGYTMTAQVVSMAVFAVIFVLASYSLFRAMKWGMVTSAGGTLLLSMLLSGSVKLREIMWGHVIYYSLGILLFMLLLNLALRLTDYMKRWMDGERGKIFYIKFAALALALLALAIGSGTDGFQVLVLSVLPIMGACFAVAILDGRSRFLTHKTGGQYLLAGVLAIGTVVGLKLLNVLTNDGAITAKYADAYSNWASMDLWWGHFEGFLKAYLNLFGVEIQNGEPLFSLLSVFQILQMIAALVILVCPFLLLFRYRRLERLSAKMVAWAHCFLTVVLMLGYICGSLSAANWRLTPMVGTGIIATLVYLRELWGDKELGRRMAVLLAALLILTAAFHTHTILEYPNDLGVNQKYLDITAAMAEKGYTKGYATFWNAANATLFSEGTVEVVSVDADANGVRKVLYQTGKDWYDDEEGCEGYFLMLTDYEYQQVITGPYWQQLYARYAVLDHIQYEGFHIVVFNGNPVF